MTNVMKLKTLLYITGLTIILSCNKETTKFDKGEADFSYYVAVGNSMSAGYCNFALYRSGQLNSFPSMIAKQLDFVGRKGDFLQPMMSDDSGLGFDIDGDIAPRSHLVMEKDCREDEIIIPRPITAKYSYVTDLNKILSYFAPIAQGGPYNNLGVPGARSYHMNDKNYGRIQSVVDIALGNATIDEGNPFYARFCSDPGNATILDDAMKINPTFFTLEIGSNDVLDFAVNGVESADNKITPFDKWNNAMRVCASRLTSKGAKGIITTVPDVTSIAFFKRYFWNNLPIYDQARVNSLSAKYPGMNFHVGKDNAFVIVDSKGVTRQIKSNELVLMDLPMDKVKCEGWGAEAPLIDRYTLDEYEMQKVFVATEQYNNAIRQIAEEYNLAIADLNFYMNKYKNGGWVDGLYISGNYITGKVFSIDGIHLTPLGYGIVANVFIDAINAKFHSSIPRINPTLYLGEAFPNE